MAVNVALIDYCDEISPIHASLILSVNYCHCCFSDRSSR